MLISRPDHRRSEIIGNEVPIKIVKTNIDKPILISDGYFFIPFADFGNMNSR